MRIEDLKGRPYQALPKQQGSQRAQPPAQSSSDDHLRGYVVERKIFTSPWSWQAHRHCGNWDASCLTAWLRLVTFEDPPDITRLPSSQQRTIHKTRPILAPALRPVSASTKCWAMVDGWRHWRRWRRCSCRKCSQCCSSRSPGGRSMWMACGWLMRGLYCPQRVRAGSMLGIRDASISQWVNKGYINQNET